MPTLEIPTTFPNNGDSYATGSKSTYPPTFQGAQVNSQLLPVSRSRSLSPTAYTVTVGLIRFDTSQIPDDATIQSARLVFFVAGSQGAFVAADARALTAEWYDPGTVTDASDYTTTAATTAHGGTLLSTIATRSGEVSLELTNLASISKTGPTGIRLHINGGSPTGSNVIYIVATNAIADKVFDPHIGDYILRRSLLSRSVQFAAPVLVVTYGELGQNPGETDPGGSNPGTEDPAKVGNGVVASSAQPREQVLWRFVLCDKAGAPLKVLDGAAKNRTYEGRMNRMAKVSFEIPSNHPRIAGLAPDGLPWLSKFRVVKGYREEVMADGTTQYVIRFTGEIWMLSDSGDASGRTVTRVTAFDSLQRLTSRFTGPLFKLDNTDGAQIVRQLVDYTNARNFSGMNTSEGKFETTPPRYVEYTRKSIGAAIVDLANAFNGFDFEIRPVDREEGTLNILSVFARLGQHQPSVVLQWGMGSKNIAGFSRDENADLMASQVHGVGATESYSEENSGATLSYGLLEAVDSFTDVTNHDFLVALVQEELNYRIRSREIVNLTPFAGLTPEPWTHLHPGDTFTVEIDESARGGFSGIMRCYGWNLSIGDDGIERMTDLLVTPE